MLFPVAQHSSVGRGALVRKTGVWLSLADAKPCGPRAFRESDQEGGSACVGYLTLKCKPNLH